ncbi:MAG: thiol-disulfide isomerase/thioredoxin [Pseudohongiellaceae bacterium]|jgi:thiol-disulfide isomerase/thioredoxin
MTLRAVFIIFTCLYLSACGKSEQASTSNQWQYINYWASWCKPCIEEIPEFNQLAKDLKGKAKVFAVNFDGIKGEQLQNQAKKIGIDFILLENDPSQTMTHTIPSVLPSTYIYTPDGKLHKTLVGPQTVESLKAAIQ